MGANTWHLARILSAGVLCAAGAAAIFVVAQAYLDQRADRKIDLADADESAIAEACIADEACQSPSTLIKLAQAMAGGNESERALSRKLLDRAISQDNERPLAWAIMAFLDAKDAGSLSPAAITSLQRSFEICPLCDNQELLRWRLQFVLHHWDSAPEDIRKAVFEGADVLRWRYEDHDFLAEQDTYAITRSIPFDTYADGLTSPEKPDLRSP